MSDKVNVDVKTKPIGLQDTGNPVLDSLVNLYIGSGVYPGDQESLKVIHQTLSELAEKEPGGLFRRRDCFRVNLGKEELAAPFVG